MNSRGLEIFSKSWLPETSQPKAVVCYCHGYGDTCTFFFEGMLSEQEVAFPVCSLGFLMIIKFNCFVASL